jgi:hypothetical protein
MRKTVFLSASIMLLHSLDSPAQMLVTDPALSAITLGNGIVQQQAHENIAQKQRAIETLQATTVSVVSFINDWHQKMYEGLVQISAVVSDAYQVKESLEVLYEIFELEREMIREASSNPLALAFAVKFQQEMVVKAIQYQQEIHAFILNSHDNRILMDAGERTALLNKVLTDLRVIKALAATSCYRVRWAVKNGIINTLNPFSAFVNRDARIVQDILKKWNY